MRISDWSSDVCSSDLGALDAAQDRSGAHGDGALRAGRGDPPPGDPLPAGDAGRHGEDARPARRRSGGARLHDAGEPPRARHRAAGSAADLPALCRGGSRHGEGGDVTAAASSSPSLLWDGALTPATHKAVVPALVAGTHSSIPRRLSSRPSELASASRDPGTGVRAVALDPRVKPEGDVKSWWIAP